MLPEPTSVSVDKSFRNEFNVYALDTGHVYKFGNDKPSFNTPGSKEVYNV